MSRSENLAMSARAKSPAAATRIRVGGVSLCARMVAAHMLLSLSANRALRARATPPAAATRPAPAGAERSRGSARAQRVVGARIRAGGVSL